MKTATPRRPSAPARTLTSNLADGPLALDKGGENPPGLVCLANEARFTESTYSQPLTTYVAGYRAPTDIEGILDFAVEPVEAPRRFEFKKATNAEEYLSEADDLRAIGADFKRVEYTGASVLEKTQNKGLTMRLDLDQVAQQSDWQERYASRLKERLLRNELRRALAIVLASATNANKVWDSNAKPDNDVREAVLASGDTRGLDANRVLFGSGAWSLRLNALGAMGDVAARSMYAQTAEQLAGFYGVEMVKIARQRFQQTATTKGKVLGDSVVIFHASPGATLDDPSDFKRFWTPCIDGQKYRVYLHQVSAKFVDLTVEHYSAIIATGVGARTLTVSAS